MKKTPLKLGAKAHHVIRQAQIQHGVLVPYQHVCKMMNELETCNDIERIAHLIFTIGMDTHSQMHKELFKARNKKIMREILTRDGLERSTATTATPRNTDAAMARWRGLTEEGTPDIEARKKVHAETGIPLGTLRTAIHRFKKVEG